MKKNLRNNLAYFTLGSLCTLIGLFLGHISPLFGNVGLYDLIHCKEIMCRKITITDGEGGSVHLYADKGAGELIMISEKANLSAGIMSEKEGGYMFQVHSLDESTTTPRCTFGVSPAENSAGFALLDDETTRYGRAVTASGEVRKLGD